MKQAIIGHIKTASQTECDQVRAAVHAIEGSFKKAVACMLLSLGLSDDQRPRWIYPQPLVSHEMMGQSKNIGNVFLYNRLWKAGVLGEIAASVLMGHYGQAVYLMGQKENADSLSQIENSLPENLGEMLAYFETHQAVYPANDNRVPSWLS